MFWDLDGPILDVSLKYYNLYRDILLDNNKLPLDKKDYWRYKRSQMSNYKILSYSDAQDIINIYNLSWMNMIETKKYQDYDKLQPRIKEILNNCNTKYDLVMVTLRSDRNRLFSQLSSVNIINYFSNILSSGEDIKPRWKIKYNLISNYLNNLNQDKHLLITDTDTDIIAGKKLKFCAIAISNGIRNNNILLVSKPDYIFNSISQFYDEYLLKERL